LLLHAAFNIFISPYEIFFADVILRMPHHECCRGYYALLLPMFCYADRLRVAAAATAYAFVIFTLPFADALFSRHAPYYAITD